LLLAVTKSRTLTRAYNIVAVSLFAGCAGITDVVPTGQDTYIVASHGVMGWSSGGAQKAKAFQQANDYCKTLGKQMHSINTNETPSGFGKIAAGEVEFRCVEVK
jgi:hypothetical protein